MDRQAAPRAVAAIRVTAPAFVKPEVPLFDTTDAGLVSLYKASLLDTEGILDDGGGRYLIDTSTDHASTANAGCRLMRGDSLTDPATWAPVGTRYQDPAASRSQEETPQLLFNPNPADALCDLFPGDEAEVAAEGLWHRYYQAIDSATTTAAQVTCLAVARRDDLTTWTTVGVVLGNNYINGSGSGGSGAVNNGNQDMLIDGQGESHFGYARVFRVGATWVAYHLLTGGDYGTFGMSLSRDGLNWRTDPRPLGSMNDFTGETTKRFTWINTTLFEYRGRWWILGALTDYISGSAIDPAPAWLLAPMTPDFRSFAGLPITITPPGSPAWEAGEHGLPGGVLVQEGLIYIAYRGAGATGAIGVATATTDLIGASS